MKRISYIIFFLTALVFSAADDCFAQDTLKTETVRLKTRDVTPLRATMLAAAFPGMGQVYNRKYWKIPLVYAGFGGIGYAVYYNTSFYNDYTKAYQDFVDAIPETQSYLKFIRGMPASSYDPVLFPDSYKPANAEYIRDQLLRQVDYFRRYRDLSYIGIAAWYIVSILDANVDASLYGYEVDDNLNLTVSPFPMPMYNFTGVGINVTMTIKF
ncbi:MAG: DUF5683 domain-containing protein [Bacteroidales bacterium]